MSPYLISSPWIYPSPHPSPSFHVHNCHGWHTKVPYTICISSSVLRLVAAPCSSWILMADGFEESQSSMASVAWREALNCDSVAELRRQTNIKRFVHAVRCWICLNKSMQIKAAFICVFSRFWCSFDGKFCFGACNKDPVKLSPYVWSHRWSRTSDFTHTRRTCKSQDPNQRPWSSDYG